MSVAAPAQIAVSTSLSEKRATSVPITTPATTGTAIERRMPGSTAPLARCEKYERSEVGTITAKVVPTQRCIRTASSTPMAENSS